MPNKPDNQFLELCRFTDFVPTVYGKPKQSPEDAIFSMLSVVLTNPSLFEAMQNQSLSPEEQQLALIKELGKDPDSAKEFMKSLQSLLSSDMS